MRGYVALWRWIAVAIIALWVGAARAAIDEGPAVSTEEVLALLDGALDETGKPFLEEDRQFVVVSSLPPWPHRDDGAFPVLVNDGEWGPLSVILVRREEATLQLLSGVVLSERDKFCGLDGYVRLDAQRSFLTAYCGSTHQGVSGSGGWAITLDDQNQLHETKIGLIEYDYPGGGMCFGRRCPRPVSITCKPTIKRVRGEIRLLMACGGKFGGQPREPARVYRFDGARFVQISPKPKPK